MSQILVYSRSQNKQVNATVELICDKLSEMGHHTEQTHSTNWARIFLNNYDLIHIFAEQLPLSANEIFFLSLAKAIGKPTILSLFNSDMKLTKPLAALVFPEALTVSQTNHFQYYRDWSCSKSVLPLIPLIKTKTTASAQKTTERPFFIPLDDSLEEVFHYKTSGETFFDGRQLLRNQTSAQLRKKWNQFLQTKKISSDDQLVLSDEKVSELLSEKSLRIVLADPQLKHTEFTGWLEKTLNQNHCLYLNDFQATGFSHAWTSGRNCQVISTLNWPQSINLVMSLPDDTTAIISKFKISELSEPLLNDISRLYIKIIRQNTTLISSDSVKIK